MGSFTILPLDQLPFGLRPFPRKNDSIKFLIKKWILVTLAPGSTPPFSNDLFLEKTAKEWEDAIAVTGGACTVCKTIDEWLVHEHAIAGKMVVEVDDAKLGKMKQPGVQVRLR